MTSGSDIPENTDKQYPGNSNNSSSGGGNYNNSNNHYNSNSYKSYKNYNNGQNGGNSSGNNTGGRQNYNNNRQPNYPNRKNYNQNQKINHNSSSNQYPNYMQGGAGDYPPQFGYYQIPYYQTIPMHQVPVSPGYPQSHPYFQSQPPPSQPQQSMVSASASPISPVGSIPTGTGVDVSSLPGSSRVKVTDQEGRKVDFEEKKKLSSASNTPISSPVPKVVSPITTQPAVATAPAPIAAPAAPAAKTADASLVAEEFRRKILQKAKEKEEAKARAEAEKKAKEAKPAEEVKTEKEAKKTEEAKPVEEPKSAVKSEESKLEEAKQEESKPAEVAPVVAEPVKMASPEVQPQAVTVEKPEPVESIPESVKAVQSETKSVEPETVAEPVEEPATVEQTTKSVESVKPVEPVSSEPVASEPVESEPVASEPVEAEPVASEPVEAEPAESESIEAEPESVESADSLDSAEPFGLAQFFNRLATAKEIEDPYTFDYPYPNTPVDSRWKVGNKKYRYDPQFLLQFQDNIQYHIDDTWRSKFEMLGINTGVNKSRMGGMPLNMQNIKGGPGKYGNMSGRFGNMSGRGGQFGGDGRQNSRNGSKRRGGSNGPSGGSGANPRSASSRKGNQSRRGGRDNTREREDGESGEPPKPAEDVKPLEKSANRWVPKSRAKKAETKLNPDGTEYLEEEEIERKTKSLLNKLTLEMFESITDDLLQLSNQSIWEEDAKTIKQIISLTFAKACDEPYWSSMYAQFCAKICTKLPEEIKDVNTRLKDGTPAQGGNLARRILLATCQTEYEKGWVDKLPTNEDGSPLEPEIMSDEYYAMAAAKRRGLGLVKFIGHLYILNMLNDHVISHCIKSQSQNTEDPSEESLENLAQLLRTVGQKFEINERNKAVLNIVFENIQTILDNCKLSSRIRFMLMDLQDERNAKWVKLKADSGPKTIQEVHDEAEIKRLEEEKASMERRRRNKQHNSGNNNSYFNDSRSNSSRGGSSWGGSGQSNVPKRGGNDRAPSKDSRGFTSVQSSRSQSNRPTADTSFSSANVATRDNSKRTDSTPARSNMFAALGHNDDNDDGEA